MSNMKIRGSTIVKKSQNQVSCNLNDQVAILNLKSSLYFGLDEVGTYIWEALGSPQSVDTLCAAMRERFEVDEVLCADDVLKFLTELQRAGLVDIATDPS